MGNCLRSWGSNDDVSLLNDGAPPARESVNHVNSIPTQNIGLSGVRNILPESNEQPMMYYPAPNVCRAANQLTEEEQIKIAQRIGLIQHLPIGSYDGGKINKECIICMIEFEIGDAIRSLPCMHIYHTDCIDDWLMRSFTCPSCMEPVDAALLSTFQTD